MSEFQTSVSTEFKEVEEDENDDVSLSFENVRSRCLDVKQLPFVF